MILVIFATTSGATVGVNPALYSADEIGTELRKAFTQEEREDAKDVDDEDLIDEGFASLISHKGFQGLDPTSLCLTELVELAEAIENSNTPEAIEAATQVFGADYVQTGLLGYAAWVDDRLVFQGTLGEYALEGYENADIPTAVALHVDWEAVGRDMEKAGTITESDGYIFSET